MHIVIFGSGGVGAGLGCYLARDGARVTFIARGEHMRVMRERGLQVQSAKGDFTVDPVTVTDDPRSVKNSDVILLCIKTWQLEGVIDELKAMIGPDTFVVPLLNSIEATDILAAKLGAAHVLGGLCYTISYIVAPGVVQSGGPQKIIFGELDDILSPRAHALADLMNATNDLQAEASPQIRIPMWEKFTGISSASAVGAVARVSVAQWRDVPETRALYHDVLRESFGLAAASGVTLDEETFQRRLKFVEIWPPEMRPSMQRDIEAGKRSELTQQIGYVVREAKRLGVPVPASAAVYAALLPQELLASAVIAAPRSQ